MKPRLADIRESGQFEQDADVVIFPYRPEVYDITRDGDGNDLTGLAELIIAKHRGGPTGSVWCKFVEKYASFENLALDAMPI